MKMDRLTLYLPGPEELAFRQALMADPATMSYNAPWSPPNGCLDFPRERWADWHARWVGQEPERFYAYLRREGDGAFVGEVDFHHTPEQNWWDMGILILARERGKGYGQQGLALLLDRAFRVNGIPRLHNCFEPVRFAALHIHQAAGFREVSTEDGVLHLLLTKEAYEKDAL